MAIQILLNRKGRGQVENLIFDLTISENHTFETEITDNEVEEGFDINDNVHVKQPKLTMTGFISNTPLVLDQKADKLGDLPNYGVQTRTILALNKLLTLTGYNIESGTLDPITPTILEIITSYRVYQNMLIKSVAFPHINDAVHIRMEFKPIKIVKGQTTIKPIVNEKKTGAKGIGTQSEVLVNANKQKTEESPSTLRRWYDKRQEKVGATTTTSTGAQQ